MNTTHPKQNLKDIADHAKVSLATVSRVLNEKGNVSDNTRAKVFSAVRELRYRVPPRNVIGMIVPDSSNPFFSQFSFLVEQTLGSQDWHLLISSSEGKLERELQLIERFKGFGVKGLVYISSGSGSNTLYSLIADGGLPVVVFDRDITAGNLDFVSVDSRYGTLAAVDYLAAHGHTRIGYVKGLEKTHSAEERLSSYVDAMNHNRFEIRESWIFPGEYTLPSGRTAAERLLALGEDRPTAILAANDLMAIGLMQRLQIEGWVLPRDLSVIGFDNITWSEWAYPALTTIAQPMRQLVNATIRLLTERIREQTLDKKRRQPRREVLQPRLIERCSVTKAGQIANPGSVLTLIPRKDLQHV